MSKQRIFFIVLIIAICWAPMGLQVYAEEAGESWQARPELVEARSKRNGGGFNYREDMVPKYSLPELLVSGDGKPVQSPDAWQNQRRPELLNLFREHVYGVRPDTEFTIAFEEVAKRENAFGVGATARQVRATIKAERGTHAFEFVFVQPASDGPVPIVVLINNRYFIPLDKAVDETDPFWPAEQMVRMGYATASFHTSHVDPDKKDGYAKGIRALLDKSEGDTDSRWGSLSAWGWAASRVLDYVLAQPGIDAERTAVVGHSRGGKTALWAGAEDPRFKLVYSNNSGCGGAALFRRVYGEHIARINRNFPHWFCGQFKSYNDKEADLPIDQHQLIALIAPRAVYVASADEDLWADPRGEYASLIAAGPVYRLLGVEHIQTTVMPAINQPRHTGATGYHIRSGKHNLNEQDWNHFLDFAQTIFNPDGD